MFGWLGFGDIIFICFVLVGIRRATVVSLEVSLELVALKSLANSVAVLAAKLVVLA